MYRRPAGAALGTTLAVSTLALAACAPAATAAAHSSPTSSVSQSFSPPATDTSSAATGASAGTSSSSASATVAVAPLPPGQIPSTCTRYDDRQFIDAMKGGTLSAPEFHDPATHPVPTDQAALDSAALNDTMPGLTCDWGSDEQLITVVLEVMPHTSFATHSCNNGQPGQSVSVGVGITGLYCDGPLGGEESVGFTSKERDYAIGRVKTYGDSSATTTSYRDVLLQYATYVASID